MGENQYVVPTDDGWGVKGEKNEKLTKKFEKKADAVDYAKDIAKTQKSELTILKKMKKPRTKIVMEMTQIHRKTKNRKSTNSNKILKIGFELILNIDFLFKKLNFYS